MTEDNGFSGVIVTSHFQGEQIPPILQAVEHLHDDKEAAVDIDDEAILAIKMNLQSSLVPNKKSEACSPAGSPRLEFSRNRERQLNCRPECHDGDAELPVSFEGPAIRDRGNSIAELSCASQVIAEDHSPTL